MAGLSPRQKAFVQHWLLDPEASYAELARRAGYSEKTAKVMGHKNMKDPAVLAALGKRMAERAERTKVDADYVLNRLVEIDQLDVADILDESGNLLPVKEWPKAWRTSLSYMDVQELSTAQKDDISSVVKKVKWPDKTKNLELLGKHTSVQAFKERTETQHRFFDADGKPQDGFKFVIEHIRADERD